MCFPFVGGDKILLAVLRTRRVFFPISPSSAKPQISQANGDSTDCNAEIVVIAANPLLVAILWTAAKIGKYSS